MIKTSTLVIAAILVFGANQFASAQSFYRQSHNHYVPHRTTHTDYVRHGNHIDAIPHTTTHFDQVPHSTYRAVNPWWSMNSPRSITRARNTRNRNYFGSAPYTNNHWGPTTRYIPHTTTHYDRIWHGNHSHTVPHTTTHWDRR